MSLRRALCLFALLGPVAAQEPVHVAYPERDALSPFRDPIDVYAPPDEIFRLLRTMQHIAQKPGAAKQYDERGRERIDDPAWRAAYAELQKHRLDAGYLAQILRLHRDALQRETAFYGSFYVDHVPDVIELIEHIPGEPVRRVRESAFPRAVEFLKRNLGRRFGDLDAEAQRAVLQNLPAPGSPAARAQGIVRAPQAGDYLHVFRIVPFLQLLDVPDAFDQAQALWFLKEILKMRKDLALGWLEPSLPRIRQLLLSDATVVRNEAIGLLQAIGPENLREPPDESGERLDERLLDWADEATRELFPPIRNLNDTIVQIHPSPERDRLAAAGIAALENSAIGDPFRGQKKDGSWYRGFRVIVVPDELAPLAIPKDVVITSVNGVAVEDGPGLLSLVREQLRVLKHPRRLFVEYVKDGQTHAIEYRLM